ncbi:MAG: MFS transporter [Erysipelotrichaceae bacterium]|nr:MFS transporter [Erysipelotrichaceae bacterium]
MSTKQKSFLSVAFILVTLSMLCQNVATQMMNTTLSPFASYMWNSKTMGGLLTSFFNIGSIVMAFFSGPLVEKIGKKASIILFSLLYGVSTLLFVFMPTESASLAARVLQGVAKGVIMVACASVVADVTPDEQMNQGMGIFGLGATLAMAFGPMLGLNLIGPDNNYSRMFIGCAIIVSFGAAFALGINYKPKQREQKEETVTREYKGIWKLIEKKALLPAVNYTIFFASFACILVFITVYAQEMLKLPATQISLFYTVAAATMLVVRLFAGKLADKYGELIVIIPGHLAIMIALIVLAFFCNKPGGATYPLFLLCGGMYGIGSACCQPAMNSIAVVDSPADRSSIANATFYFMMDFGILFSSSVFGGVIDRAVDLATGYRVTYLASFGICILSLLMAVFLLNRKARSKRAMKQ